MRELSWGGVPNVRDLGGLPTVDGGATAFGRVARGPRRELLDARGWEAARAWGLQTVVDLRCDHETGPREGDPGVATPADVTAVQAPLEDHDDPEFRRVCFPILDSPEYWEHNLRILPDLARGALEAVATAQPGILVHCSAGRDRTGLMSALLLSLAGVPGEVVAEDYALSVQAMAGTATHAPTHDRQEAWTPARVDAWVDEVGPIVIRFVEQAPEHLARIGLAQEHRDAIRTLLRGNAPVTAGGRVTKD